MPSYESHCRRNIALLIVDSHVHIALHMYEPVEILLAQMQHNQVEKTVLVQSSTTTDNLSLIHI